MTFWEIRTEFSVPRLSEKLVETLREVLPHAEIPDGLAKVLEDEIINFLVETANESKESLAQKRNGRIAR